MKRLLQMFGLVLIILTVVVWAGLGANRGWTKTTVPVTTIDEVTGIEGITYENRFMPGVEFLGGGVLAGGLLLAISMFVKSKETKREL